MPFIITPRQFTQRAEFYHQLAQLTAAGLGVTNALEQINRHPPGHSFRKPLQTFLAELAQGKTLSDSLRCANWLPDFDLTLIEAGERSGRLDSCFRILADYYNERARLVKQILAQLAYPVFLIHFAAFVFWVVLPYASSQFNASILWLFVKAALKLSPIYIVTVLIIFASQSKHGEKWRAFMETILNPVPVLGSARRSLALSRLSLSLEALISAGVNIVEAWNFAAVASNSSALRHTIEKWKLQLEAGRTPAELVKASSLFPESFASLYGSGEISGKLDETLRRLHIFYQEDGSHKLQLLAQWVPRGIYIIVALVIAYKIVTFYSHYFSQAVNPGF